MLTAAPDAVVRVCDEFASPLHSQYQVDDDNAAYPIEDFLVSGAVETCLMTPDDDDDDEREENDVDAQGRESETNTIRNSKFLLLSVNYY